MEEFMQKFIKSAGNHRNAQSLNRKYFKIARYSFNIFNPNLAHFCDSEVDIYSRTQVNKLRPALVLCDSDDDVTVCFITTQFHWRNRFDFDIVPSALNGSKKLSIVRISKIATLDKTLVTGKLGTLEQKYIGKINMGLIQLLQLS